MSLTRHLIMWSLPALLMGILGTLIQTEFVLMKLSEVGANMSASDRWRMRFDDLTGLGPAYSGLCFVGFIVAFETADRVHRKIPLPRPLVFSLAGAVCLAVMFVMSSEVFFGSPIIAGTRSVAGFSAQIGLASLAGLLAARMSSDRS